MCESLTNLIDFALLLLFYYYYLLLLFVQDLSEKHLLVMGEFWLNIIIIIIITITIIHLSRRNE